MLRPLVVEDFYGHAEHNPLISHLTISFPGRRSWGRTRPLSRLPLMLGNPQLFYTWRQQEFSSSPISKIRGNIPGPCCADQCARTFHPMDQKSEKPYPWGSPFSEGFYVPWPLFGGIYGGVPFNLWRRNVLSNEYNKERASMEEMQAQIGCRFTAAADLSPRNRMIPTIWVEPHKGPARRLCLANLSLYQDDFAMPLSIGNRC